MKRKLWLLAVLVLCLALAVGILAACNGSGGSGQQTPGGENPGTETPGDNPGGEDPGDETVSFIVTFDTQGGSVLADITVENGQAIGEFTLPTKQCSRLVGFALDAGGERMWDVLTDKVSADITLYAIWEDAHDWGEWGVTTPATCTENGEKTRTCNACGETEKEVVPAAHTWGEWETVTPPTCTTDGTQKRMCEECGKEETGSIPALEHDFAEEYTVDIAPDCETKGSESRHCTRCNATTDSREIAALGHTWGEWETVTDPTCTAEGTKKRVCEACGKEETGSIPALGHNFTRFEYDDESHRKICERCSFTTEKTPHIYDESGKCECGAIEVTPDSEFAFAKLDDGTYSVTGYTGTRRYVRIPSAHDGAMVTSIGSSAFSGCSGLTSITIPDSVTSIGGYAFEGCSGLTTITVTDGNPKYHSAGNCLIEAATKTLIAGCKTSIIPDDGSVTSIGNYAFYNCSGLTSITIPDSVTSIGSYAFEGCSRLTSIVIPDGVTSIGSDAFYGCRGLTSVTIGDSVTSIGSYAFSGCTGLTSITIPDSVTSIGSSAFGGCSGLTSITIGDSVTSIGSSAFSGCTGLTEINWNVASVNVLSYSGVFYNAGTAGDGITVIFGDSVQRIPAYLFYVNSSSYRPNIKSVTIGNSVTSIGDRAFSNCSGLTSITIPDSVTSIGSYAFSGCSSLTSVTFEGTVDKWNVIDKGMNWNFNCPFTEVVYSDGTVSV